MESNLPTWRKNIQLKAVFAMLTKICIDEQTLMIRKTGGSEFGSVKYSFPGFCGERFLKMRHLRILELQIPQSVVQLTEALRTECPGKWLFASHPPTQIGILELGRVLFERLVDAHRRPRLFYSENGIIEIIVLLSKSFFEEMDKRFVL